MINHKLLNMLFIVSLLTTGTTVIAMKPRVTFVDPCGNGLNSPSSTTEASPTCVSDSSTPKDLIINSDEPRISINDTNLSKITLNAPHATHISFANSIKLQEVTIITPNLAFLDFSGCSSLNQFGFIKETFPCLVHLDISNCTSLASWTEIKKIVKQNHPFKFVSLAGCTQLSWNNVADIIRETHHSTASKTYDLSGLSDEIHENIITFATAGMTIIS